MKLEASVILEGALHDTRGEKSNINLSSCKPCELHEYVGKI